MFKVDNGAVSEDVDDMLVKDPGRDQVEREFSELIDNCVTGVAAALVPDDNSYSSARRSIIRPLPSSPQLTPTTHTFGHFALPFRTALQAFISTNQIVHDYTVEVNLAGAFRSAELTAPFYSAPLPFTCSSMMSLAVSAAFMPVSILLLCMKRWALPRHTVYS
jgi:hypothetical protein